jgi:hypothetical protein
MRQAADLLHELDAVEFGQLEIGQHHVHAVLARILERTARRVEELQVELGVDLPHDFRNQQAAAEEVIDDQHGIALGAGEGELRDHAGGLGGTGRQSGHGYLPEGARTRRSQIGTAKKQ